MPLIFKDFAHIFSLRLKSELDAFPRINGAVSMYSFSYAMIEKIKFKNLAGHLQTKESEDCLESFQESLSGAYSFLVYSLLKQNLREIPANFDYSEEAEFHEWYMYRLITTCDIVRNENDIKKVIDGGIFNYFLSGTTWGLEKKLNEVSIFARIRDASHDYINKKYKKTCCRRCSGGPCHYEAHDANLNLEEAYEYTRDGCPWLEIVEAVSGDNVHPESFYLGRHGIVDKLGIHGFSVSSGCCFVVPETGEVKWMDKIQQKISHINYGCKRWIGKELPKLISKQRGISLLVPFSPFFGGALFGGFLTFLNKL